MKTFIRLTVLLIVTLLIFATGFWLGKRGNSFTENQSTNLTGDELASTEPSDKKIKPEKESALREAIPAKNSESTQTKKKSRDPAQTDPSSKQDGPVEKKSPDEEASAPKQTSAPPKQDMAISLELEKEDKESAKPADSPAVSESVKAITESPTDVAMAPQSDEKKQKTPPLIMTPEDLGKDKLTYSIQAGAFLERELAEARLTELLAKQYPAFLVSAWDDQKQLWYTVRVGRYQEMSEARRAARELSQKERIPAYVYGIGSLKYEPIMESEEDSRDPATASTGKAPSKTPPPEKEPG